MRPRFRLIIFDLDGTLIDSTEDIATATNLTLAELSLPPRSLEEVGAFIGDGALKLIERALPEALRDRVEEALARFREHYLDHLVDHTTPYEGIQEMLQSLEALPKALASNKPERFLHPILAAFGWNGLFDPVLGGDSLPERKPHPLVLETACRLAGVRPEETLMVGDGAQDMEGARAAGILPCGVTWGFRSAELLVQSGAEWLIDRPSQLADIVFERP